MNGKNKISSETPYNIDHVEGLKCMYTNSDCLTNKMPELERLVSLNSVDVIAVSETLPKNKQSDINYTFHLTGYQTYQVNDGRGVCLFIKEHLEATRLEDDEKLFSPNVFVKVKLHDKNDYVILGVMYRSPNSSNQETDSLIKQLDYIYTKYVSSKVVIMGDFNFSNIDWSQETCNTGIDEKDGNDVSDDDDDFDDDKQDKKVTKKRKDKEFLDKFHENFLHQFVKTPTHRRGNQTPTLIDLIIANDQDLVRNLYHCAPLGLSHHDTIYLVINCKTQAHINIEKKKLLLNKGDYNGMRELLRSTEWEKNLDGKNVDECWAFIENEINTATELFVPKLKINTNKPKHRFSAPDTLINKIKIKRVAYKYYKKFPTASNYEKYAESRAEVNRGTKAAQLEREKRVARDAKENPKAFFSYISSKVKPRNPVGNLLTPEGRVTETDEEKARELNTFFSSVFTKEDISETCDFSASFENPLNDVEISVEDMKKKLQSIKEGKSPGPDKIHPKILKENAQELALPLKILFDKTLNEGKIPHQWKLAEVIPIFKKGSKSQPGNYRPVSLTSVICKIFETFIRDEMYKHFINNNLLSSDQYGFCQGRSCTSQLLVTLDEWMNNLDQNIPTDAIFLDFAKAFDTVPHKRLLTKVEGYGVQGKVLKWIESFLTDRMQYVAINGKHSGRVPVSSGVPQGSVLGPTLFIYFINDLPSSTTEKVKVFADDTKNYKEIRAEDDAKKLQDSLDMLVEWSEKWLLRFNSSKCKVLHVGKNNPEYKYFIKDGDDRRPLETTENEKDLGVIVDKNLTFENHINETLKKCRNLCGLIMGMITFKTKEIMIPLYKALVRPIIEYANSVWCPYKMKHIKAIERIQRNFTKRVFGIQKLNYNDRLKYLKLPSLEYRRVRGDMIEAYKIINNLYDPLTTSSLLTPQSKNSITRSHGYKLFKERANKKSYSCFFTHRITNLWNSLPEDVVNAKTLNRFKNNIDKYLKNHIYKTKLDFYNK